jgi:hypothetical protein
VERLEASRHEGLCKQWQTAMDDLLHSMETEHVALLQSWMREHCGGLRIRLHPGETISTLLTRYRPPGLVRAVWLLMFEHMGTGAPVALPANVAAVYLSDHDAFPVNPCDGCRYLLPARAKLRPDGIYRHVGWYMGECPVCGLDNHPDEERAA